MLAGLPIVATGVGGIPEMLADKKNGLLAKPADAKDLAEKIKILLEQPALGKNLGQQAQIEVKAKFSLEKMVAKTKKIYNK